MSLNVALSGSVKPVTIDGTFPDSERVIPHPTADTHVEISVNAGYLANLMAYAARHAHENRPEVVLCVPKDPTQAIRADFVTDEGTRVTMVVMPLKPSMSVIDEEKAPEQAAV